MKPGKLEYWHKALISPTDAIRPYDLVRFRPYHETTRLRPSLGDTRHTSSNLTVTSCFMNEIVIINSVGHFDYYSVAYIIHSVMRGSYGSISKVCKLAEVSSEIIISYRVSSVFRKTS